MSSDQKSAKRPTRLKDLKSKKTAAIKTESIKGGRTTPGTSFGDRMKAGLEPGTTAK